MSSAQLASFNTWLCQRSAAGAGTVQTVSLPTDPHGRAVLTACLLARCGIRSLSLRATSPGLLDAACTISSLTHLQLTIYVSQCSLDPLGALRQLQSLWVDFYPEQEQGGAPPSWQLPLPCLTWLKFTSSEPCTFSLDSCSALEDSGVRTTHAGGGASSCCSRGRAAAGTGYCAPMPRSLPASAVPPHAGRDPPPRRTRKTWTGLPAPLASRSWSFG